MRRTPLTLVVLLAPSLAAGAPAGTTPNATNDAPAVPAGAPAAAIDVAKLRADYDRLRDELYRARARAELVEEGIYESRIAAKLRWEGAPDFLLHRAEVRLDGNLIWDSGDKPMVDELVNVAERPIKPGVHSMTVRLEVRPGKKVNKETSDLGYSSEHTFVVKVLDKRKTLVEITADDDGDLPEYEPELEVEVQYKR